jgi:hypothetical protein
LQTLSISFDKIAIPTLNTHRRIVSGALLLAGRILRFGCGIAAFGVGFLHDGKSIRNRMPPITIDSATLFM